VTNGSIIHMDLHKPNNKLINVKLEHFRCMDKPWANTNSQDSPQPGLGGSHHLPPYGACTQMSFCFGTPKLGVLKFSKLGFLQLWRHVISCEDLVLIWGLKKSFSHHREFFNVMWHATCAQVNRGDSRLLVVESQIGNLTPNLSFGHNLYFKYPNGLCEPILNIYVPRAFQWV
jgi:hypothetical protein